MALSIRSKKDAARSAATTKISDAQVEALTQHAAKCALTVDVDAYGATWKTVAAWKDADRRLQARKALVAVLNSAEVASQQPRQWGKLYAVAAEQMWQAISESALEPLHWNTMGVLLYELGYSDQARTCFQVVQRLEPEWPSIRENLRASKVRRPQARKAIGAAALSLKPLAEKAAYKAKTVQKPAAGRLSLVMIVRDEEDMLGDCLESVKGLVDEMIVVDTGSTDRTVEIAESYGATVDVFEWNGSFSDARNRSLDLASGDWVLHLDADERLYPEEHEQIRELLRSPWRAGFYLEETNLTGDHQTFGGRVTHAALRIWRHRPEVRFEGIIHEQKNHTLPVYLPERFLHTSLRIMHLGYQQQVIADRDKHDRNISLLLEEARTSPTAFNRFNLATEYLAMGDNDMAVTLYTEAWEKILAEGGLLAFGFTGILCSRYVRALRLAGRTADAERIITTGLSQWPQFTDLVYEQAQIRAEQNQLDDAIALYEQCIGMGDAPAELAGQDGCGSYLALLNIIDIHINRGDYAQAEVQLDRCMDAYPGFDMQYARRVHVQLKAGQSPDTIVASLPANAREHMASMLLVAGILYEDGYWTVAAPIYEDILERQPHNGAARVGWVECALSDGDFELALQRAGEIQPGDLCSAQLIEGALFCLLADLEGRDGDRIVALLEAAETAGVPAGMIEALAAWAALDPEQPMTSVGAAHALKLLGGALKAQHAIAAEVLIELILGANVPAAAAHAEVAQIMLTTGYLQTAREFAEQALGFDGGHAEALATLATALLAEGDRSAAAQVAQDLAAVNPDHPVVIALR